MTARPALVGGLILTAWTSAIMVGDGHVAADGAADTNDIARATALAPPSHTPQPPAEPASWRGNCIYDNGDTDGWDAYSNGVNLPGGRRALLDDFVVPDGETWTIDGIRHIYVWPNDVGFVFDVDLRLREDNGGTPGSVFVVPDVIGFSESQTGRFFFSLSEYEGYTRFAPVVLDAGHYWFEMALDAQTNNFWLVTLAVENEQCWVDYDDFSGLVSGSQQFGGVEADLSFCLTGDDCGSDLNDDGVVDFGDIVVVLSNWGQLGGPGDCNGDGIVDFGDIVCVIGGWGNC